MDTLNPSCPARASLDQDQLAAVTTDSRRALVLAGAGSGKTRVLTERIAYLIEKCHASPSEIVALAFTRKAAGEMRERLVARIGRAAYGVTMGTMHALALRQLQRFGEVIGLRPEKITVYSEWEEDFLLRTVATEIGALKGKSWKIPKKAVDLAFSTFYATGIEPAKFDPAYNLFNAFMGRCRENNALTYGGILNGFMLLLPLVKQYMGWRHILVDEVQDLDRLQWGLIEAMARDLPATLFAVGDVDQCQPAGTMVLVPGGEVPIESLQDGDKVRAWDRRSKNVQGENPARNAHNTVRVASRSYTGLITTVEAAGKKTEATSNHRWLVRWGEAALGLHAVYLMRKTIPGLGECFRVGWCKIINAANGCRSAHYKQRARLEGADGIWILKVTKSRAEASAWESIINVRYGIPTVMFNPIGTTLYTEETLRLIWQECAEMSRRGFENLADDFDVYEDMPLWKPSQEEDGCRRTLFETVSANLCEGMEVPVWDGGKGYDWNPVTISRRYVESLPVYSLEVGGRHAYIANGICTLNCIYSWRGAAPEYLVENADSFEVLRLARNYRSDAKIVMAANRLIENNVARLPKAMIPMRMGEPERHFVSVVRDMDSHRVAELVPGAFPPGDIAVLSRKHVLLQRMAEELDARGVPYNYVGRKAALTNPEEFRRFHAFLKLIVNPYDNFAFLLIKDILGLTPEEYSAVRALAVQLDIGHLGAWLANCDANHRASGFFSAEGGPDRDAADAAAMVGGIIGDSQDDPPHPALAFVMEWRQSAPFGRKSVAEYLEWLATYDVQDEITTTDPDGAGVVTLATIHGAKGLEWPCVILAGCNEGILPSERAVRSGDIEEERRLAYVAITRARDQLVMAVRPERTEKPGRDGQMRLFESPVSRFVAESMGDSHA